MRLVRPVSVQLPQLTGFAAIRANAGVKLGSLTPSGSINATSNQVISGKSFAGGQVYIGNAINVKITNCQFTGNQTQYWAVESDQAGTVTIEDCTFDGYWMDAAVNYSGVTMRRCEIVGMYGDGVKLGSNCLYEYNWIHDFIVAQGAHSDGMQIYERVSNVTIQNNVVEVGLGGPYSATDSLDQSTNSALILNESQNTGTAGPITVTGNLLGGGGFTVYFDMPTSGTGTTFSNNQLVRNSYRWGALDSSAHAHTWTNNTYSDNGQVIAMPGTPL